MTKKVKIPSFFVRIVKGPYKGYYAEYRSRLRQGEFVQVIVSATGQSATVPIDSVVFLMEDGKMLQYSYTESGGITLGEVNGQSGETVIKSIKDIANTPARTAFITDEMNVSEYFKNEDNKRKRSDEAEDEDEEDEAEDEDADFEEEAQQYLNAYNQLHQVERNAIHLDDHPLALFLKEMFGVLGFDMDNTSVNQHSKILKDAVDKMNVVLNTDFYKLCVITYIFIFVNNMNIGYPILVPGCPQRPNDDPEFILCAAQKSGFINPKEPINIQPFISKISNLLDTRIIPSDPSLQLNKKFSTMGIKPKTKASFKADPVIKITQSIMRFPLLTKDTEMEIKEVTKEKIIKKAQKKLIQTTSKKDQAILQSFINDFDNYVRGPMFMKINNNPSTRESKILIPFVKEYRERKVFEEDKYYKSLKSKVNGDTDHLEDMKEMVVEDINTTIRASIKNKKLPKEETEALKHVLDIYEDIVSFTGDDVKDLKLSLITAEGQEKENILASLRYRSIFNKLLKQIRIKHDNNDQEVLKNQIKMEKGIKKLKL